MATTERTGTVTITPDLSGFVEAMKRTSEAMQQWDRAVRVLGLRLHGKHALADVVQHQPGRQIVRDGMADVLVWLGEER